MYIQSQKIFFTNSKIVLLINICLSEIIQNKQMDNKSTYVVQAKTKKNI